MSTPFNVRAWASQAGIETTGGFSVIAECVTVDELERFAQIAISQYVASQRKEWQGLTDEEIRNEANHHVFDESFFNGAIWARGQIMGKNNG